MTVPDQPKPATPQQTFDPVARLADELAAMRRQALPRLLPADRAADDGGPEPARPLIFDELVARLGPLPVRTVIGGGPAGPADTGRPGPTTSTGGTL